MGNIASSNFSYGDLTLIQEIAQTYTEEIGTLCTSVAWHPSGDYLVANDGTQEEPKRFYLEKIAEADVY